MEAEEDNLSEHPSNIDSDTSSEDQISQEKRDNTDVENLTDTDQSNNYQSKENSETDDTNQLGKRRYRPTRNGPDRNELPDADLFDNWRSTETSETDNTNQLEKIRYRPTRDGTERSELPDSDSIDNWRSTGDQHNDDQKESDETKYQPARGDLSNNWRTKGDQHNADQTLLEEAKYSTNYQTARGDLSNNWRTKADPEPQCEESEETDKPMHFFTRQSRGASFPSQFGYNTSRTNREDQYNEDSEQTVKPKYPFTIQPKGARYSSQAGFNSRNTRGNYKDKANKYSLLKSHSIANYDEESKNEIRVHKTRKLGIVELSKMEKLEPSEIIMKLAAPGSGLKELANETSMDPELVKKLLEVLSKAIECISSRQNLIHILSHILNSLFLKHVLSSYIMQCGSSLQSEDLCSVVDQSLTVLTEILSTFPSSSFADVTIIKIVLESVVRQMEADSITISEKTKQNMEMLKNFLQHIQDKKQDGTLKSDNYIYAVGKKGLVLGDDFRGVSVFPTHDDIYMKGNPRLAPNIIDGSYPDVTSYLNTHFSLLREDFIGPLRDGISQYLSAQSDEDVNDIRIYFKASILKSICVQSGIVYRVHFSTSHLKHISWENSQRLIYGSLVCLSNDNFNSMLFATVAERDVDDLKQGIITLMFEEESRQQLAKYADDDHLFVMAETTAYFEAYCHTLQGLKEMKESNVPFQNYIVHCETMMSPPDYLLHNHSPFTLEKLEICSDSSDGETYSDINKNKTVNTEVNVLDFDTWPTKEDLEFDESQFEAYQKCLTSELSIIQGPPGTGKTYVGLKVVHTLLKNGNIWRQGRNPILIVCYTNHALDQFLEGIYKSNKCKIVRVGSRSNSELMQKFSLNVLRRHEKPLRRVQRRYSDDSEEDDYEEEEDIETTLEREADMLKSRITYKREIIESAYNTVIEENDMKNYMNDDIFLNFISNQKHKGPCNILSDWLGLASLYHTNSEKTEKPGKEKEKLLDSTDSSESLENEEEKIEVIKEPEIALLERQLDGDNISEELARIRASKNKDPSSELVADNYTSENHDGDSKWKIKEKKEKEKMKLRQKMKTELLKRHYMSEEDYKKISDICAIPNYMRWEIYRMWRQKVMKEIRSEIFILEDEYIILINRLVELKNQQDCAILQRADIIGMTTTGAAKYRKLLQVVQPKIVIVEEAAEVLEAHIITTLSRSCQHLILIGDHQQLRPATTVYELAKNFNLEVSMFERLIRRGLPYVRLNYQHRMRPEIAQLLTPHIYDKLENHECVYKYDNVKSVCQNLFFVDHSNPEHHISEGKSHQNVHEAAFVKSLCLYIIQQGYAPSQITILTTYSGQLHCLQKMMPRAQFDGVRVCVVDKYQGEENEIIILSLVRSNLFGNVGFLKIPNRVCVALSRAKKGLYCIGNMQMLSKVPLWSAINDVLQENGLIGKELKLQCVNHPETATSVSKSSDFADVPEGGCKIPCQFRLNCGHVCPLLCHPYDQQHENVVCRKPCSKSVCENEHKCRKLCSDPCGKCEEIVPKVVPLCGHIQDVPCSMDPEKFCCKEPCIKILQCGHKCVRLCSQTCTQKCPEKVTVTLICGHTVKTMCHMKTEADLIGTTLKCHVKCGVKLDCGHNCRGSCSSCDTRGFHLTCGNACGIPLYCSHKCEEKCKTNCFCNRSCENSCFHRKCVQKCSEPCTPCRKPCGWRCKHKMCRKLCCEPCDREACDEPCRENLECGHPCIGFCGEPCPKKCRICNADEVQELVFGNEAKPDARFVQLMDCPHFFEVTKFSEWMVSKEEDEIIKLKSCPKCLKPIRKCLRYGNLIKKTLSDVEKIKERISYKWMNNLEMFLSDNDTELSNIPQLGSTVQQLQEDNLTLRSLMLVGEKITFWQKLGVIQNRIKQSPKVLIRILNDIPIISKAIASASSKYDILQKYYELFRMALEVEISFSELYKPEIFIQQIQSLINEMYSEKRTMHLDELHARLQKLPVSLDLINILKEKTAIYDTEMLRQHFWHRCESGHIYTTDVDENKSLCCPQCSVSDEEGEEDEYED